MPIVTSFFLLLTQPLTWVLALLVLSLLARRRPALGRMLVGTATVLLLLLGWQPLPDLRGYVGMVVLGGSTEASHMAIAQRKGLAWSVKPSTPEDFSTAWI